MCCVSRPSSKGEESGREGEYTRVRACFSERVVDAAPRRAVATSPSTSFRSCCAKQSGIANIPVSRKTINFYHLSHYSRVLRFITFRSFFRPASFFSIPIPFTRYRKIVTLIYRCWTTGDIDGSGENEIEKRETSV